MTSLVGIVPSTTEILSFSQANETPGATVTIDMTVPAKNGHYWTASENETVTLSNTSLLYVNQELDIIILSDGNIRTITFDSTYFITTGTLVTVPSKKATITFRYSPTQFKFMEWYRNTAVVVGT